MWLFLSFWLSHIPPLCCHWLHILKPRHQSANTEILRRINIPLHHISVTLMVLQFCDHQRSSGFSCLFPRLLCFILFILLCHFLGFSCSCHHAPLLSTPSTISSPGWSACWQRWSCPTVSGGFHLSQQSLILRDSPMMVKAKSVSGTAVQPGIDPQDPSAPTQAFSLTGRI